MFLLCYPYYYRTPYFQTNGRNSGRSTIPGIARRERISVIAQELTYYGIDRYKKQMLPELIERISDIPGVEWIRLHYAYPAHFPTDLFRVMRERDNVCKYMDIALQHISDNMLQLMRRQVSKEDTYRLIEQFRKEVPGIHLRTTLMVGHPGETEEDFEELKEFVRKVRFRSDGELSHIPKKRELMLQKHTKILFHKRLNKPDLMN